MKGIPRGPAGQSIDVRFTYDLNGVLEVEATVVDTRQGFATSSRGTQGMSAGDISKAVADMQSLKRHPRDEAENQFVIRRAERLLPELPYELGAVRGASRRIRGGAGAARQGRRRPVPRGAAAVL